MGGREVSATHSVSPVFRASFTLDKKERDEVIALLDVTPRPSRSKRPNPDPEKTRGGGRPRTSGGSVGSSSSTAGNLPRGGDGGGTVRI